ncbi:SDR family NAD(P)-dependent oxidoreductase [Nostoc sp. MG11]|uniref:SDR family NAD(P)-dependent oxidoreductase n=1 Tax=Nostoc sp. MG11 TaxID=2721166 RepID=UPI0029FF1933|nr:SDR family NAD(P)-dependent oxidoreductase [Nostoc sp. MG11]
MDILINNADIERYCNFVDYSLEKMQSVLTTNLVTAMEITSFLLPSMLEIGVYLNIYSGEKL